MPILDLNAEAFKVHPDLPIHRLRSGDGWVYYTPGRLLWCGDGRREALDAALRLENCGEWAGRTAGELVEAASATVQRWRQFSEMGFRPEALTVHLSDACNLSCRYCYSGASGRSGTSLDLSTLEDVACRVATSCASHGKRLAVAFHGGGEPTLPMQRLRRAVEITQAAAGAAGLEWGGYLATNGTFDPGEAVWLGQRFERISVSCDGPADVQDELRPLHADRPSAPLVESGLQALCEAGAALTVRATITRRNLRRQAELVRFFHGRWSVNRIRMEPVYLAAGNPTGLTDDDAETFVQHFLEAEETGRACGCDVSTSCVRLDELHGPYCDFLRGTVVLCADGRVRHCAFRAKAEGMAPDWPAGGLLWRQDLLLEARRRTLRTPPACIDCLNRYHCSRNCPDICYCNEEPESPGGGFRCRVARALTTGWLQLAAASIQAEQTQRAMLCDNPSLGD